MRGHRRAFVAALVAALTIAVGHPHGAVPAARAATCPSIPVQQPAYPDQPPEAAGDATIVGRTAVGPLPDHWRSIRPAPSAGCMPARPAGTS